MKKLSCIFISLFIYFHSYTQNYVEYSFDNLTFEGKVIYEGNYKPNINMSSLKNGIYIVKISFRNNQEEILMMIKNL
jgi:hypothetical protein